MKLFRVKSRMKGCGGYINAARPTKYGNPFALKKKDGSPNYPLEQSLELYAVYIRDKLCNDEEFSKAVINDLCGKEYIYFGCTCPLNQECHVDVLIGELMLWMKRRQLTSSC